METTSFVEAQANYEMIKTEYLKLSEALESARQLRNSLCPHTTLVAKSDYFSGSYLDQAYTNYWTECACCGTKSVVTTKHHSWYG